MPSYIIKPDRDRDFYVIWSEIVDNVKAFGTRAELTATAHQWGRGSDAAHADRFDRADATGTSANWSNWNHPQPYSWDEENQDYVLENEDGVDYDANGAWLLHRSKLVEFCRRKAVGESVADLLTFNSYGDKEN